jgi:hypothetical protein
MKGCRRELRFPQDSPLQCGTHQVVRVNTETGSEDHADWMRRASRMLGEDGRAERGVERLDGLWSGGVHAGQGWRVLGLSAMRG